MICIDCRWITSTGIGRYLQNALEALSKEPQFQLILLHHAKDRRRVEAYSSHLTPIVSPVFSLQEQLELPLKIPPCDLFWSPHFNVPFFPLRSRKRVVTLHDVYHLSPSSHISFAKKKVAKIFLRKAALLSNEVWTVSEFSKEEIVKHMSFSINKIRVVKHGIQSDHFSRCHDETLLKKIRLKYALPEKFFLHVGNGKHHKNLKRLISANEELGSNLVLAGCKKELHSKKNVHALGFVADEDLPPLYTLATALIFPSLYEGFGLPPLEAMACGCPVVVSAIPALQEISQEGALYCDPCSVASMREAMQEIEKRSKEFISKGFGVVAEYGMDKWKENFVEAIKACCNHS